MGRWEGRRTMFLTCLCPTFRRPRCLANVVACFLAQDYPAELRELVILDDAGQYETQQGDRWRLISTPTRFPGLPQKYNSLASLAAPETEAFVVWEDDDVYLPGHLTRHAEYLARHEWCHPSRVYSNYQTPGTAIHEEGGLGRFHGGWSYRRELFERVGGYIVTPELSFDQQMGRRLSGRMRWWDRFDGDPDPGDPTEDPQRNPTYVFRWGNPYYHGQAFGDTYYATCGVRGDATRIGALLPAMDSETARIYGR